MTDQDRAIRALAEYLAPALRYPLGDIARQRGRLLGVLGVEAGAGVDRVEAALREFLGGPVPGPDELAAAIRDTPILVENYGFDDSVGAFTAMAMLPDELAAILLDKARDEAGVLQEHQGTRKPARLRCAWCETGLAAIDAAPILCARNPDASDDENMQCADQDACRGRQDELNAAWHREGDPAAGAEAGPDDA